MFMFPRHGGGSEDTDSDMSGMDMGSGSSDSSSSSTMEMMMKPYLHFTKGDIVLFNNVAPSNPGAIFGACLIFFLLAALSRYVAAASRGIQNRCVVRSRTLLQRHSSGDTESKNVVAPESRFIFTHDLARAGIVGVEYFFHYLLMLVVMTFNASYIISIILGTVVGEFSFGRLHRY